MIKKQRRTGKKPSVRKARNKFVSVEYAAEQVPAAAAEQHSDSEEAEAAAKADASAEGETAAPVSAERVFHYFREIAAIPHGSHHTEEISNYLVRFAEERGLSYTRDDAFNVIITKQASEGAEEAAPIALQGHIDMVLASDPDKEIDMLTQPISIVVDGDWMHADGTTLGADNGIAVAMMLAALEDDSMAHPLLECIFTSDEEVGLVGASAIDLSDLKSRRLLNLDSETEGVFCAGCAGGANVLCGFPLRRRMRKGKVLRIRLSGLMGGHSGTEIHLGRANANVLMSRVLHSLYKVFPFRLVSIEGGDADNSIAASAQARIQFRAGDPESIAAALSVFTEDMRLEYSVTEPDMAFTAEWEEESAEESVSKKETGRVLDYLLSLPNGFTQMNPVLKEMPQTSLNLGVLRTGRKELSLEFMVRSNVNSQTAHVKEQLICITKAFGGTYTVKGMYPAWEFVNESPFRDLAAGVYRKLNGKEPGIEVIHAGLECGILSGKVEDLDCISTGPDLENVHTARERMSISSAQRVWRFVAALLEEAAGC